METKQFRIASMPSSRPADYYLGYYDDSVFIDFNNHLGNLIVLKRISFDGYGCCRLPEKVIPMDESDSKKFKEIFKNHLEDQKLLRELILKNIQLNKDSIWNDALLEYGLL
ncbi:hypothetical protein GF357_02475 [Candidatus Dojkabacteria bacterium]|nr:hypothetical protein [Candidatus Dojkabacteria bacterium]